MAELLEPLEDKTMKFLKLRLLAIAAVGFAFSGTANAQNTQDIVVTATVPTVCVVDVGTTETTMAFGTLAVAGGGPFDSTTTLAWRCTLGSASTISIGPGGSGDQENREMLFGIIPLLYNLYTDGGFGTIWGDGGGTTSTVGITGLGMGAIGNSVVFGRIQSVDGLAAVAGIYTDTVLVTITP